MKQIGTPQSGFSLIEMLVALTIMSFSLVLIYQAIAGSARGLGQIDANHGAVMLAESLLDGYRAVPAGGLQEQGEDAIYRWSVGSSRFASQTEPPLYLLQISVEWEGRSIQLETLRPELPSAEKR